VWTTVHDPCVSLHSSGTLSHKIQETTEALKLLKPSVSSIPASCCPCYLKLRYTTQAGTEATKIVNLRFPSFRLLVLLDCCTCPSTTSNRDIAQVRKEATKKIKPSVSSFFCFLFYLYSVSVTPWYTTQVTTEATKPYGFCFLLYLVGCPWLSIHTTLYIIQVRKEATKHRNLRFLSFCFFFYLVAVRGVYSIYSEQITSTQKLRKA